MTRRPVLALVIDAIGDPERRERDAVKRDRAVEITYRKDDMVEHTILRSR